MRDRDARSSASWALRSVMSVPQTMYLSISASGRSHQAMIFHVPDLPIQAVSCSILTPASTCSSNASLTSAISSGGATRSQNFRPITSSSV